MMPFVALAPVFVVLGLGLWIWNRVPMPQPVRARSGRKLGRLNRRA